MYGTPIETILGQIDRLDAGRPRKNITILGAGMAGLVAAYELSRLGHSVTIIEAQDRVGGRVWTWRPKDNPSQYHELGAMRIPKAHDYTLYYVKKCKLKLRRFVNHHDDPDSFYLIRGIATTHRDAIAKLIRDIKFHKLSDRERQIIEEAKPPSPLGLMSVLDPVLTKIRHDPDSLKALFGQGRPTELIEKLESQTLFDFLEENLDTEDAIELVGAVTGLEVWWERAITMLLRDEIIQHEGNGTFDEIEDGMDQLPRHLRDLIKDKVTFRLNAEVRSIDVARNRIQLTHTPSKTEGEITREDCDYVICTIPFGALRRLRVAGVTPEKLRAIRNLTYASATKVLLLCRERFWEQKYGIVGSGSQTDLIIRQIYYPSDSFRPHGTIAQSPLSGASFQYDIVDKSEVAPLPEQNGVLVGSYNWGADARRLGALSRNDRMRVVCECVAQIHPEIAEPGMILDHASIFWDGCDWSGGAFCYLRPGDFDLYYSDTIKPEENLFFAGEHCSLYQGWIQGAISSSLRAVKELVGSD